MKKSMQWAKNAMKVSEKTFLAFVENRVNIADI